MLAQISLPELEDLTGTILLDLINAREGAASLHLVVRVMALVLDELAYRTSLDPQDDEFFELHGPGGYDQLLETVEALSDFLATSLPDLEEGPYGSSLEGNLHFILQSFDTTRDFAILMRTLEYNERLGGTFVTAQNLHPVEGHLLALRTPDDLLSFVARKYEYDVPSMLGPLRAGLEAQLLPDAMRHNEELFAQAACVGSVSACAGSLGHDLYTRQPVHTGDEALLRTLRIASQPEMTQGHSLVAAPMGAITVRLSAASRDVMRDLLADDRLASHVTLHRLDKPHVGCVVRVLMRSGQGQDVICRVTLVDDDPCIYEDLLQPYQDRLDMMTGSSMELLAPAVDTSPWKGVVDGVDVTQLQMDEPCQHADAVWVPDNSLPQADGLVLECAQCQRLRLAHVWRHQLPQAHPEATAAHEPHYLMMQALRERLQGLPARASISIADLVSRDGSAQLNPQQYVDLSDPLVRARPPLAKSVCARRFRV